MRLSRSGTFAIATPAYDPLETKRYEERGDQQRAYPTGAAARQRTLAGAKVAKGAELVFLCFRSIRSFRLRHRTRLRDKLAHMRAPSQKSLPPLLAMFKALIDAREPALRTREMVEHPLHDMRLKAKLGHA